MPKEVKVLNNFSGGINSSSDSRDIQDNEVSSESRVEGYDDKAGQFVDLKNAEVDNAGVIRVSGGQSAVNIISDLNLTNLASGGQYNLIDGTKAFTANLDLSLVNSTTSDLSNIVIGGSGVDSWNVSPGSTANVTQTVHETDVTDYYSNIKSVPTSEQTENQSVEPTTTENLLDIKFSHTNPSSSGPAHDADAYTTGNLGYIESSEHVFYPGYTYTVSFKMKFNKKWPVHGASYPPWLEIWNDDVSYDNNIGICYTPSGMKKGSRADVYGGVGIRMSANQSANNIENSMQDASGGILNSRWDTYSLDWSTGTVTADDSILSFYTSEGARANSQYRNGYADIYNAEAWSNEFNASNNVIIPAAAINLKWGQADGDIFDSSGNIAHFLRSVDEWKYVGESGTAVGTRRLNATKDSQFGGGTRTYDYAIKGVSRQMRPAHNDGYNYKVRVQKNDINDGDPIHSFTINKANSILKSIDINGNPIKRCVMQKENSNSTEILKIYVKYDTNIDIGDEILIDCEAEDFDNDKVSMMVYEIGYTEVNNNTVPNYSTLSSTHASSFNAKVLFCKSKLFYADDYFTTGAGSSSELLTGNGMLCKAIKWTGFGEPNEEYTIDGSFKPLKHFTCPNNEFYTYIHPIETTDTSSGNVLHMFDDIDVFKAGLDLQRLSNSDKSLNPYVYNDEWREYSYTFTIPESVATENSDRWNIRLNFGCVSFNGANWRTEDYDASVISSFADFRLLLDDINVTSSGVPEIDTSGMTDTTNINNYKSNFTTFFTAENDNGTNLYSAQNGIVKKIHDMGSSKNVKLAHYQQAGRIYISDSNFANDTKAILIDTGSPFKKEYNLYQTPYKISIREQSGESSTIILDRIDAHNTGIDYVNFKQLVVGDYYEVIDQLPRTTYGRVHHSWNFDRTTVADGQDSGYYRTDGWPGAVFGNFYDEGNYDAPGDIGVLWQSTDRYEIINLSERTAPVYDATNGKFWINNDDGSSHNYVKFLNASAENQLLSWNYDGNRIGWAHSSNDTNYNAHRKKQLFTTFGKDALCSKLKNDIAKIDYEIEICMAGYRSKERFNNEDYQYCANFTGMNLEFEIYRALSTDLDHDNKSAQNHWISPNGSQSEITGAEMVHRVETNPDRLPMSSQFTFHKDPRNLFAEPEALGQDDISNNYSWSKFIKTGSIDFDFGEWPLTHNDPSSTHALALNLQQDNRDAYYYIRSFVDTNGNSLAGGYQFCHGFLHAGFLYGRINKINIYGYTEGTTDSVYPSNEHFSNAMLSLNFESNQGHSWDSDAIWSITSVNNYGEESALKSFVEASGASNETSQLNLKLFIKKHIIQRDNVYKLKLYMKRSDSDIFYLQAIVDLVGLNDSVRIKSTTSGLWYSASYPPHRDYISFELPSLAMVQPNQVDSFESQTQLNPLYIEPEYYYPEQFKTAVVVNNRVYAGNLKYNGREYPDRMVKSPYGKYGQLPLQNYIDVAINDGDEIIHLDYYKDFLFQFKKRKVFVINVAEDYEFLADSFDGIGVAHSSQVCKTPKGIAWINSRGCFFYDGEELKELTKDKLSIYNFKGTDAKWEINDDDIPSIGYMEKTNKLIIFKSTLKETIASEGYIYNIDSGAWQMHYKKTFSDVYKSNFIKDANGDLGWLSHGGSGTSGSIKKWDNEPQGEEADTSGKTFKVITRDFVFGNPGLRKKVYKVYVTYKTGDSSPHPYVKMYYAINGEASNDLGDAAATDDWTAMDVPSSTNYSTKGFLGASQWKRAEMKFTDSTNVNNIYSLQLKFEGIPSDDSDLGTSTSVVSDGFMINDIEIVYRSKNAK